MQNNLKTTKKAYQKILKDLAMTEADHVPRPLPKYYSLHRKDGMEPDFINTFLRNAPEKVFYFLTASENLQIGAKGFMQLKGKRADIEILGPKFMVYLDGKGTSFGDTYQGKFNDMKGIPDCEAFLKDHFKDKETMPEGS